jgi:hypothetical protein
METLDFTPRYRFGGRKIVVAGLALNRKVAEQVEVSGAYQAARNLRKQGYGIDVALALVAGRV